MIVSSFALAACGKSENTVSTAETAVAAESKRSDPIKELKPFIEERESKINDGGIWNPGDSLGNREMSAVSVVTSFDVKQTDSLVSPYLGTISYEVAYTLTIPSKSEAKPASAKCREAYAYQDGQWVLKSQELVVIPELDASKWESYPGEVGLAGVACGFTDS